MYEWLMSELKAIQTPRFHVRTRAEDRSNRRVLPPAYTEFLRQVGGVKLYRTGRIAYYLGVFGKPYYARTRDGTWGLQVGFVDGASIYLRSRDKHSEIVEQRPTGSVVVQQSFSEWVLSRCVRARRRYSEAEWRSVLEGPEPFTTSERAMLACRKLIEWQVVGTDEQGMCVFVVTNNNKAKTLPLITIGVRSRDGSLNGAIALKIGHIGPGESRIVHADCYKEWVRPDELEVFAITNLKPEDRQYYDEFKLQESSGHVP